MLRWLTAGESHGQALVGILEGLPSGIEMTTDDVRAALARRRLGYGRGARQKFEQDELRLLGGLWRGSTTGAPFAVEIGNSEWPKWSTVMSPDPVDAESLSTARAQKLTRPRPGHADLAGMQKYRQDDARAILERSSARETATRVALGVPAAQMLRQALGVELVSHVVAAGSVDVPADSRLPGPGDVPALDADPVRCFDPASSQAMVGQIDEAQKAGDTLGGVVEVLAYGLPPGLGSHVTDDRRLDSRLAAAMMGIQAIKGVEIGDGFLTAHRRGSQAHDEIVIDDGSGPHRLTDRAGGIEGGMTNGEILRVRAALKPISTVPRALRTFDTQTGEPASAHHQRSDVCAVAPAAVIAEAMTALILAQAALEKFGGDSVIEVSRNHASYLADVRERHL